MTNFLWKMSVAVCCLLISDITRVEVSGAEIELLGAGSFAPEAVDLSGLPEFLETGVPHNRLGGLSALEYTGSGQRYIALPDRGPADGAVRYACRFQVIDLDIRPGRTPAVVPTLVRTTLLKDASDRQFVGAADAFDTVLPSRGLRLDPEGVRVTRAGDLFVSDEYGPLLLQFCPTGKEARRLTLPSHLYVAHAAATKSRENARNTSGRQSNGGMEGLAITPDGKWLAGLMQTPLLQDQSGEKSADARNIRLVLIELATGATRELLYQLERGKNKLNEIVAVNDHEFIIIERDGEAGALAGFKRLYRIDITEASDISGVANLPSLGVPSGHKAVRKQLLIDLLEPRFGLVGTSFPEKLEALTFGPDLPDGRHLLIVGVDNDFKADMPSWFYAFAIPAESLPGFGWNR